MNKNDTTSSGCDDSKIIKDDDSVLSERCWEEKYRGDSRKWLIRDGSRQKIDSFMCSTMKDTYQYPLKEDHQIVGIRRLLYRNKLEEEIIDQVIRERNQPPPVEEYCTEYDSNYIAPGYEDKNETEKDSELFEKYPLYGSIAASFWKFSVDKGEKGSVSIPGFTTAADIKNPFKRSSDFTKPISEVLDDT